jgi:phosphoglycerate kinase
MNKKSIRDLETAGRRVLIRVDFNVPLKDGKIEDDTRISTALPSIQHLLDGNASVVLMSHLGRPGGKVDSSMTLKPVAAKLSEMLNRPVQFMKDCIGNGSRSAVDQLLPGEVILLENLRFHPEEEGKTAVDKSESAQARAAAKSDMKLRQKAFAKHLASYGDCYVNDAFGTAHRAHASVAVVTEFFDLAAAGFLLEKELEYLGRVLTEPKRPFVAILGGAKISGKIDVIMNLIGKVDSLLIGGGMAYTFFRAQGHPTGNSLVEEDKIDLAAEILERASQAGVRLLLPVDTVIADDFSAEANTRVVGVGGIEEGWEGLDVGPETRQLFASVVADAGTVVWNGPLGCFEMEPFAVGTIAVAQAVAAAPCISIIGGGDTASAINKAGLADQMTHISTGGGASLEFLEGKELPGVAALTDA